MPEIKLYSLCSIINQIDNKINVPFMWFVNERVSPPSLPFKEIVVNFENLGNENSSYVKEFLYEKFREDEVVQFREYLKKYYNTEIEAEELSLPLAEDEQNFYPYKWVPVGGGVDCYLLYKHKNYNLPFEVCAYYDLRFCEDVPQNG